VPTGTLGTLTDTELLAPESVYAAAVRTALPAGVERLGDTSTRYSAELSVNATALTDYAPTANNLPKAGVANAPGVDTTGASDLVTLLGLNVPVSNTPLLPSSAGVVVDGPATVLVRNAANPGDLAVATPSAQAASAASPWIDLQAEQAVRAGGVALSVGVVVWVLRAGGLVASLMVSLPVWRQLDPMPVLDREAAHRPRRNARLLSRNGAGHGAGHGAGPMSGFDSVPPGNESRSENSGEKSSAQDTTRSTRAQRAIQGADAVAEDLLDAVH
jgi:hypothetical protein